MRAILIHASDSMVEQRRRRGTDKKDERWRGEWHFVNPPKRWHARLNADLFIVLAPLADRAGLEAYGDNTGIFADPEQDWRVPDQAYARAEDGIEQGLRSAMLVVEICSPGDESYEKLPFYSARAIPEVLMIAQDRTVELFRARADGQYALVENRGGLTSAALGATFSTVPGPRLKITWDGGAAEV